jgi:Family of unknown function (DUF6232)
MSTSAHRFRKRAVYYNRAIVVTSTYVQVGRVRIPVAELQDVVRCLTYRYPVVKVALVTGAIELALAAPFAAVYGSAVMLGAGVLSALGMALGALVDARRNPRFMALEATCRGRRITLFRTADADEFGRVRTALIRALEDNREPLP